MYKFRITISLCILLVEAIDSQNQKRQRDAADVQTGDTVGPVASAARVGHDEDGERVEQVASRTKDRRRAKTRRNEKRNRRRDGRWSNLARTSSRTADESAVSSSSMAAPDGLVGNDVKTRPYDPMLYDGSSGGPVKTGDDLECKSGQACCWANSDSSSLKWQSAKGTVESSKFQSSFSTQRLPDDNYLLTYSDNQRGTKDKAVYESCSIGCADGDVEVEFRYWTTTGVKLELCTKNAFFGDTEKFSNCRDVQKGAQSGLAKVTVPGGQLMTLDIVASSFISDSGSVAVVDHINVNFKPCQVGGNSGRPPARSGPSPQPPTPTAPPAPKPTPASTANDDQQSCQTLQCTFDHDTLCGYREYRLIRSSVQSATKGFAVRRGQFENLLTGVTPPKDNGAYAAAYLYAQDGASLQSDTLKLSDARVLRFNAYFATQGLRLKVCLDTETNCPLATSSDIQASDRRKWKRYNVLLPKGTTKVFIIAENTLSNQGAVGIDNIELLRPSTTGSLDAEQTEGSACNGFRN